MHMTHASLGVTSHCSRFLCVLCCGSDRTGDSVCGLLHGDGHLRDDGLHPAVGHRGRALPHADSQPHGRHLSDQQVLQRLHDPGLASV